MNKLPYETLEELVAEARTRIPAGSRWRHYKGTKYIISDVAIMEATNEVTVIYTSVDHPSVSFVRPLGIWQETVEWDGRTVPRFTSVGTRE
jgi:hypothetical protein